MYLQDKNQWTEDRMGGVDAPLQYYSAQPSILDGVYNNSLKSNENSSNLRNWWEKKFG